MDGIAVSDVAAGHGVEDDLVFLLGQAAVGGEGGGTVPCGGGVDPLQPGVVLDLLQGGTTRRVPLQHTGDQTGRKRERDTVENSPSIDQILYIPLWPLVCNTGTRVKFSCILIQLLTVKAHNPIYLRYESE